MNRSRRLIPLTLVLLAVVLVSLAPAQWPDDPSQNLLIAGNTGEQATPLVGATSDGGAWVLYYDHASGNYDVYLQLLDADGVPQFDGGLLVSDNPMTTFITEWDFAVDDDDHAIVVTNDIRDGGDWDIFAYRIAPDGTFVWGADGIQLSANTDDDVGQDITVLHNGDILIAWQQGSDLVMRRLTPEGTDPWNGSRVLTAANPLSIPRAAPTVDGGYYFQYIEADGGQIWSPRNIFLRRYDVDGQLVWGDTAVPIHNAGGLGFQMRHQIISSPVGAYSVWYDSHQANQLHAFAQRTDENGNIQWPANGIIVSTATELQMSPKATVDPGSHTLFVSYATANTGQTQWGLGAQWFAVDGTRMYGDTGRALTPIGSPQAQALTPVVKVDTGVVFPYVEDVDGDISNSYIKAVGVSWAGNELFPAVIISAVISPKLHTAATAANPLNSGTALVVWGDERGASRDIYLQNVNIDGSLGPWQTQGPAYLEVLNPTPTVIPAGGGTIHYDVRVVSNLPNTIPNVQFWTTATLPGGQTTQPLYTTTFTLYSGMDFTADAPPQMIPGFAPDGVYSYNVFMGFMNGPQTGASFSFTKLAATAAQAGSGSEFNAWTTRGELDFDGAIAGDASPAATPDRLTLSNVYPNPFNPTATVSVTLPASAPLRVEVVNLTGQVVDVLADSPHSAGTHTFSIDGSNLASGVYLLRANTTGIDPLTRKLVLIK